MGRMAGWASDPDRRRPVLVLVLASTLVLMLAVPGWAQQLDWVREFRTGGSDEAYGVARDASGEYIVGKVEGALPGQAHPGGSDAFVRKYDAAGNEFWTRQFGTSGQCPRGSGRGRLGSVYVSGGTSGAPAGPGQHGGSDAFVRKYDAAGNALWTRQFGTASSDWANGVAIDSGGAVYVVGVANAALPGPGPRRGR